MSKRRRIDWLAVAGLLVGLVLLAAVPVIAEDAGAAATEKPRLDIYGFIMLDMGYQAGRNDPDWYDVVRPTKMPADANQFGEDGRFFAGVRQTRFGVKGFIPTELGEVKTIFEWELFGVGDDAGQTTIRLRHAWGELGHFGAGQTWSPFMDIDVWPNSIEYWGPSGMVFYRNVQFRWTPVMGDTTVMVALERPGAGIDGQSGASSEWANVQGRFPLPDLSANVRRTGTWGHVQFAGILRRMNWDDVDADSVELSGNALGWGLHASGVLNVAKSDAIRASVVYGEGIQNYMNDASNDIGAKNNSDLMQPVVGEALPIFGMLAFYDRTWSNKWTSTVGYSFVNITNSNGQAPDAFKRGHYALVNILYHPTSNVLMGPELQWGRRENNSDGWSYDDFRVQFSAKYNFDASIGGK